MGQLLLGQLPMWVLGLLYVAGPALLTGAVALLLRRRWRAGLAGSYRETGGTLLTQMLAVYGIVLAFVIVNQYGDYNETSKDVQTEALNIEDLYRSSFALPPASQSEVSDAVREYTQAVVDDEWQDLGKGESNPAASAAFSRLYRVLRDNQPTDPAQLVHYDQALSYLHTAHDARHRRLDAAAETLPGTLSAFLVLGALASVASTFLLGLRLHQLVVPMSLAALLGFTLLLSLTLDHPFTGDSGISSKHFTEGELATFFSDPGPH